ncbi:hypothetical protein [Planomonospora venezuelensis]|uniref:Uncharacterized protein n=1 Tax=Planomonospora venezuelensis TaxID=1999 RepID=A0A841DHA8_PLAVE|nr:hypothetical protein [Planomonospora venezuelensis]MBB5968103.1 hypothetical protein [Planomonospora venezuelensis]
MVGLVLAVVLAAVAPSSWSGGWRSTGSDSGLWVPQSSGAHQSTAPRFLSGGAEHLPAPGQPRSLPAAGAAAALLLLVPLVRLGAGPAAGPRRTLRRVVTPRSPPAA